MLDFTSALYLGMRHERDRLEAWPQFTTGKPAALEEPPDARAIARALAALQGADAAVLAASTLHLAWDLFVSMARNDSIEIHMDAGTYPIARWGVERAAFHSVPVQRFSHHGVAALTQAVSGARRRGRRPVVVSDGFCPGCGRLAPLREYLACAERHDGWLVLDDTQALGILGATPDATMPYGYGGGGSLRHCGLQSQRALVFSSLAKGLGVPIAVLAGGGEAVGMFERSSETRVHCSPPSLAVLRAAAHALTVNRLCGEALRSRLLRRVRRFRSGLRNLGMRVIAGLFPVQTLQPGPTVDPLPLWEELRRQGIQAVLQRAHFGLGARLTFLLSARHEAEEIDCVAAALGAAVNLADRRNGRATSAAY